MQEIPTLFGKTFDVVERFVKSASLLNKSMCTKTGDAIEKINNQFSPLLTEKNQTNWSSTLL